jgi:type IV pilus assembly protein PilA
MKKNVCFLRNNDGFSLVELIVVIAIMAVLVGVLAPSLTRHVDKTREAKDDQNLDGLAAAMTTAITDSLVSSNEQIVASTWTLGTTITQADLGTCAWMVSAFQYLGNRDVVLESKTYRGATVTIVVDDEQRVRIEVANGAGQQPGEKYTIQK